MKILGTGLSGLVGSRITELLSPKHEFENYSLENGVDITNRDDIISRITRDTKAPWVLHLAAYTDVQAAEADRALGEQSAAWKVNVIATEHIVEACVASGKRLLYVDTDYAFDGKKQTYTEEDSIHPLCWYAMTKSEGAKRVLGLGDKGLVIRISNPYRAHPIGKKDFAHKMLERLLAGTEVIAPADQLFVPTFIDDIAFAVDALLAHSANGIYHVVGSQGVSPYDVAKTIARVYACDPTLVKKTTFAAFFAGRAQVPQYAVLQNEKIRLLGVVMRGFDEGITEVKRLEDAGL
ncbi:MAG: sugar nucleotide-binding protein [Patescibacteria group bacterium]